MNSQVTLTTEELAQAFETTAKIIRLNFQRHKKEFTEEKHYFEENKTYRWTLKGIAHHAFLLNTNQARIAFETMLDTLEAPQINLEAFKALQEKYRAALELAATHMEIKEFKVPFDEEDMEDGVMIIARLTDYYQQLIRKEKNPAPIHQAILRELKQTNKNWTQTRDYLEEHYDEVNRAYIEQASLKHLVSSSADIAALTTPLTALPQIESPHKAS